MLFNVLTNEIQIYIPFVFLHTHILNSRKLCIYNNRVFVGLKVDGIRGFIIELSINASLNQ